MVDLVNAQIANPVDYLPTPDPVLGEVVIACMRFCRWLEYVCKLAEQLDTDHTKVYNSVEAVLVVEQAQKKDQEKQHPGKVTLAPTSSKPTSRNSTRHTNLSYVECQLLIKN